MVVVVASWVSSRVVVVVALRVVEVVSHLIASLAVALMAVVIGASLVSSSFMVVVALLWW